MARPLRGYWSNGVSLAVVWTESSSVPREPATVKTTASAAGSTAVKEMTFAPSASLMPATPPAGRPCGRTWAAWNRSNWASSVMKTRSSSPVRSSTAPTIRSPSLRVITSSSSLLAG